MPTVLGVLPTGSQDPPPARPSTPSSYPVPGETESGSSSSGLLPALFKSVFETEGYFGGFHSARLSALAHWRGIWPDIELGDVTVPVLFLQCTEPFAGLEPGSDAWRTSPLDSSHEVRTVATSHFAMIEDDLDGTAGMIEEWLAALPA